GNTFDAPRGELGRNRLDAFACRAIDDSDAVFAQQRAQALVLRRLAVDMDDGNFQIWPRESRDEHARLIKLEAGKYVGAHFRRGRSRGFRVLADARLFAPLRPPVDIGPKSVTSQPNSARVTSREKSNGVLDSSNG